MVGWIRVTNVLFNFNLYRMSLKETIMEDIKTAMREKNQERLSTLRMVSAAMKNVEIDKQIVLTDEQVMEVLRRQVKQLTDALQDFVAGNREDLAEPTRREILVLESYLPAQMTDEELQGVVEQVTSALGTKSKQDFGKIMGAVVKAVEGRADGNRIKEMVNKICV